jgi:uncharacterized protein YodC (DUF2158 family)
MAKQFQQGDIVQLVSGGPEMTVEEADDHMPEDARSSVSGLRARN